MCEKPVFYFLDIDPPPNEMHTAAEIQPVKSIHKHNFSRVRLSANAKEGEMNQMIKQLVVSHLRGLGVRFSRKFSYLGLAGKASKQLPV